MCVGFSRHVVYESAQANETMLSARTLKLFVGGGKKTRVTQMRELRKCRKTELCKPKYPEVDLE